ncbi:MAG: glycosyltransferase [Acidimicrobiales bacterium]
MSNRFGAADHLFASCLAHDHCVAVARYTKDCIVEAADSVDERCGTDFGDECRDRVVVSYPAVDIAAFLDLDPNETDLVLARRSGLADRIDFLTDVDDIEKRHLMAGTATYVLPSNARQEFVETFGIVLVEKMLAGGGPVITTPTRGIPEAVGDTAIMIPPSCPPAIALALDEAVLGMDDAERAARADKARKFALQFDRLTVLDDLMRPVLDALG